MAINLKIHVTGTVTCDTCQTETKVNYKMNAYASNVRQLELLPPNFWATETTGKKQLTLTCAKCWREKGGQP